MTDKVKVQGFISGRMIVYRDEDEYVTLLKHHAVKTCR
jgi:hypothetical protein